jgi:hypothetical protein
MALRLSILVVNINGVEVPLGTVFYIYIFLKRNDLPGKGSFLVGGHAEEHSEA